jgi:hypothetical protein
MDSKNEILRNSSNIPGYTYSEKKIVNNFIKGFKEDFEYLGEDIFLLYEKMYGGKITEYLKEDLLNERLGEMPDSLEATNREMSKIYANIQKQYKEMKDTNSKFSTLPNIPYGSQNYADNYVTAAYGVQDYPQSVKTTVEKVGEKLQSELPSPSAATEFIGNRGPDIKPPTDVPKVGFFGGLWGQISKFFTDGWNGLVTAIQAGNWGAIAQIPLVQWVAGIGGAAILYKVLKRIIFGKKRRK